MNNNYLEHHGIKGMKWYERRFQNEDGSLTPAGRERYGVGKPREASVAVRMKNGLKRAGSAVVNTTKAKVKAYVDAAPERKATREAKREEARKAKEIEAKRKSGEYDEDDEEYAKINSQEKLEDYKQKLIRSADANKLVKRQDLFTTQELQDALTRIQKNNQISDLAKQQAEAQRKNSFLNRQVDKWSARIDTGLKIVGTIDKVKSGMKTISAWSEDDKFMNLTPEEMVAKSKYLSSEDLKSLASRAKSMKEISENAKNIANNTFALDEIIKKASARADGSGNGGNGKTKTKTKTKVDDNNDDSTKPGNKTNDTAANTESTTSTTSNNTSNARSNLSEAYSKYQKEKEAEAAYSRINEIFKSMSDPEKPKNFSNNKSQLMPDLPPEKKIEAIWKNIDNKIAEKSQKKLDKESKKIAKGEKAAKKAGLI